MHDVYIRKEMDEKVIIEIQDAHGIFEAQKHIQELIRYFQDEFNVNVIGLEGATGRIPSAFFRSLPNEEVKEAVVMDFMKRGELSGGEAAMILNPKQGIFYGIEDKKLYFENLDAYLDAMRVKDSILDSLNTLKAKLDSIRGKIYSQELIRIDNQYRRYKDETLSLLDYAEILEGEASTLGIDTEKTYPALHTLFVAQDKEMDMRKPDMQKAGGRFIRDIKKIIENTLPADEIREFNSKLQEYNTGQIDQVAFVQYLHGKAQQHKIPLERYEDIYDYFAYRENLQKTEGEKLFREVEALTKAVKRQYFRTKDERELDDLYDRLDVIEKLARLEALHEDLDLYESNRREYRPEYFKKSPLSRTRTCSTLPASALA